MAGKYHFLDAVEFVFGSKSITNATNEANNSAQVAAVFQITPTENRWYQRTQNNNEQIFSIDNQVS